VIGTPPVYVGAVHVTATCRSPVTLSVGTTDVTVGAAALSGPLRTVPVKAGELPSGEKATML
jgi:hypothetical protein